MRTWAMLLFLEMLKNFDVVNLNFVLDTPNSITLSLNKANICLIIIVQFCSRPLFEF